MRRYKLYLATGRVLEVEAKSAQIEAGRSGDRLSFRGEKNQLLAEFWLTHLIGYGEADSIADEEKA